VRENCAERTRSLCVVVMQCIQHCESKGLASETRITVCLDFPHELAPLPIHTPPLPYLEITGHPPWWPHPPFLTWKSLGIPPLVATLAPRAAALELLSTWTWGTPVGCPRRACPWSRETPRETEAPVVAAPEDAVALLGEVPSGFEFRAFLCRARKTIDH
jgi:hypothetical protein